MDRNTISEIVCKSLDKAFSSLHCKGAGSKEWTKTVKTQLCETGKLKELYTCARDVPESKRNHGEWLYDVCWLKHGDARPGAPSLVDSQLDFLKEAILIVECEWWYESNSEKDNLGDIRDDFQKLLVGRACVRCMIWEDKEQDKSKIAEWLARMVKGYSATAPDDFYLLARYTDEGFQYWHLFGSGTLSRLCATNA